MSTDSRGAQQHQTRPPDEAAADRGTITTGRRPPATSVMPGDGAPGLPSVMPGQGVAAGDSVMPGDGPSQ